MTDYTVVLIVQKELCGPFTRYTCHVWCGGGMRPENVAIAKAHMLGYTVVRVEHIGE